MEFIQLKKIGRVYGKLYLPGSKSISNRILLLSSLGKGDITIKNLLHSNDVSRMLEVLKQLGIKIKKICENEYKLSGYAHSLPNGNYELYLENAGTAVRSMTAALTASQGSYKIIGNERMNNRPIKDLVNALKLWGCNVTYVGKNNDCPPLLIEAHGLKGGITHVKGAISSQYITALLMIAPYAKEDSIINIEGTLTSIPYVEMTLKLMKKFGILVKHEEYKRFFINANQRYKNPSEFIIESDASSASYFLAAAAINGEITIQGYNKNSLQGEAQFANVLALMGAKVKWGQNSVTICSTGKLNAIDIDMNEMTDTGITLAVLAVFAKGKTHIRNIANWQVKESPRITAVANELKKLGAKIEEGEDYLFIEPPKKFKAITVETYDDHRIAMAFSLLSFGVDKIRINNPKCTNKTLPDFFKLLDSIIDA